MVDEFLENRRVRKALEKAVDPGTAESLLRDGVQPPQLQQGRIEFVLAFVRGENPAQVSDRTARVADVAISHGAMVHDLIGALVIVAFGTHPSSSPDSGSRSSLVQALREQLAADVKIVHGAADGHYGLFGSQARISYTFLVPHFDRILGALSRLEYGNCEEFIYEAD
jgi:hypothetical protein